MRLVLSEIPILFLLDPTLRIHHANFHVGFQFSYFYKLVAFRAPLWFRCLYFNILLCLNQINIFPLVVMLDLHLRVESCVLQNFDFWFRLKVYLVLAVLKILLVLNLCLYHRQFWVRLGEALVYVFVFEKVDSLDHYKLMPVYSVILLLLLITAQYRIRVNSCFYQFWRVFDLLLLIFFKLEPLSTYLHDIIFVCCVFLDSSSCTFIFFVNQLRILLN